MNHNKMHKIRSHIILLLLLAVPDMALSGVVSDSLYSPSLSTNLIGESATGKFLVYLPPDYEKSNEQRYPVVFLLHSFGSRPSSWLGENGYEGFNLATRSIHLFQAND